MKQKAATQGHGGFFPVAEIVDLGPRSQTAGTQSDYSFATVRGAVLLTSSWALTFWICAACSLSWTVRICICLCCWEIWSCCCAICFCCCAAVACNFSTLSFMAWNWGRERDCGALRGCGAPGRTGAL